MRQLTGPLKATGYTSDATVSSAKAVTAFTGGVPADSEVCWISCTGAAVRYRVDASASGVTNATGHKLPSDGEPREFSVAQARAMYVIEEAATATVSISWFRFA